MWVLKKAKRSPAGQISIVRLDNANTARDKANNRPKASSDGHVSIVRLDTANTPKDRANNNARTSELCWADDCDARVEHSERPCKGLGLTFAEAQWQRRL